MARLKLLCYFNSMTRTFFYSVLCLIFVTAACSLREQHPAPPVVDAPPRFVGRTVLQADGAVRLSWSNTQVVTAFDGPSIAVTLQDVPNKTPSTRQAAPSPDAAQNVFDVIIDAQPPKVFAMHPQKTHYLLAEGLHAGRHTLTLIKRTEPLVGDVRFLGFQTAPGSHLLPPEPPQRRRIEFIGDSITAGYGNEGADANCRFTPLTENSDLAFGPMAARALHADVSVIAWSGHGLIRNRDASTTDLLGELYQRVIPSQTAPPYDPRVWHPDAVVINLATNDFAPGLPDVGDFAAAYVNLVDAIHHAHPKAHVFMGVGPMLSDDFPPGQHHLSVALKAHKAVIQSLKAHNDTNVTLVQFATQDGRRGFGCDWHPSLATHAAMAVQLAQVIAQTLGW